MKFISYLKIFFALLTLLISLPIFALTSDQTKPAHFISDNVTFNEQTGITIFTGHVVMNQGTTHLCGDKVTTYKDKTGKIYKAVAVGNLAHYSTLPDHQTTILDAYADTIEYYPQKGIAILIDNGKITHDKNVFTGPHIVYDINNQTISSSNTKGIQSTIIIQPQNKTQHGQ